MAAKIFKNYNTLKMSVNLTEFNKITVNEIINHSVKSVSLKKKHGQKIYSFYGKNGQIGKISLKRRYLVTFAISAIWH